MRAFARLTAGASALSNEEIASGSILRSAGWLAAGGTEKLPPALRTLADYHDGTGRRLRLDDGTRL